MVCEGAQGVKALCLFSYSFGNLKTLRPCWAGGGGGWSGGTGWYRTKDWTENGNLKMMFNA